MSSTQRTMSELAFYSLLKDGKFTVPAYQRTYSWDLDNCSALWDDILFTTKERDSGYPLTNHFMSSVLIKEVNGSGARKHIVDGQQRILTVTLILLAAKHLIDSEARHERFQRWSSTIEESLYAREWAHRKGDHYVPRIVLANQESNNDLEKLINGSSKLDSTTKTYKAYSFFKRELSKMQKLDIADGLDNEDSLFWKTIDTVLHHLTVIYIPILPHESPQKIFESVNGLTKELVASELIKNYLLMSLEDTEKIDELYLRYWSKFDGVDWSEDKDKDVFTDCLYAWLKSKGKRPYKNKSSIYKEFKKHAQLKDLSSDSDKLYEAIEALSKEIHLVSSSFEDLEKSVRRGPKNRIELFYNRVIAKNAMHSRAILFKTLTMFEELENLYQEPLEDSHKEIILLPIESYIMRRFFSIKGYTGGNADRLIAILRDEHEKLMNSSQTLEDYLAIYPDRIVRRLSSTENVSTKWTIDEEIIQFVVGSRDDRRLPNEFNPKDHDKVRILLVEFEYLANRNNAFRPSTYDSYLYSHHYQVEHWMPQNPRSKDWRFLAAENQKAYTYSLGNLAIIPDALNRELGNDSLRGKLAKVKDHLNANGMQETGLKTFDAIVQPLLRENVPQWDEAKISKRATQIIKEVFTHAFPDASHFMDSRFDPDPKTKSSRQSGVDNELWDNPIEGRELFCERKETKVYGVQTADKKVSLTMVENLPTILSRSAGVAAQKRHARLLEESVLNSDGTLDWIGETEPLLPSAWLTTAFGSASANLWQELPT